MNRTPRAHAHAANRTEHSGCLCRCVWLTGFPYAAARCSDDGQSKWKRARKFYAQSRAITYDTRRSTTRRTISTHLLRTIFALCNGATMTAKDTRKQLACALDGCGRFAGAALYDNRVWLPTGIIPQPFRPLRRPPAGQCPVNVHRRCADTHTHKHALDEMKTTAPGHNAPRAFRAVAHAQ